MAFVHIEVAFFNILMPTEPATILIDGEETCTESAGEFYRPRVITASPVILCCEVIGYPDPTANWTRVFVNGDGVAVEIPVEELGDDFVVDAE